MLKAGLIGIGSMGRGHLDNYVKFEKDGQPIKLTAICDIDPTKFTNYKVDFNLGDVGADGYDFSKYNCYTDIDEMLEKEDLDMVTIALPTYLHCEAAVKALNHGINVLCEKPMALNADECKKMIVAANANNKKLMIGQCLRFWGEYEVLKSYVEDKTFGNVIGGYFFRGGSTPLWSYENWLLKREKGGGALLDQHVHDVDMINYLFGMPRAVTTLGRVLYDGSGYDTVTTNYIYSDGKAINAQDDWALEGNSFGMIFRVNFEGGTLSFSRDGFFIAKRGETEFTPTYDKNSAYYKETVYFANAIINDTEITVNPPEDSLNTIKIVMAEIESADNIGKIVELY